MTKNNETSRLVNNSTQAATPNARKRVTSTCAKSARLITPYSELKVTELKKRTWRISLNCMAASSATNLRTVGIYHTDLYEATSQDEAVGIAVQCVSRRFPFFDVDLRSVKCSTLNPVAL